MFANKEKDREINDYMELLNKMLSAFGRLRHFIVKPFSVYKPCCKYDCSDNPIGEHSKPYCHKSQVKHFYKKNAECYAASPHDKGRSYHRKFYVASRPKSIWQSKCAYPY